MATVSDRERKGREVELRLADEGMWKSLPDEDRSVIRVILSANKLEKSLGMVPGELPESLIDGEELVLAVVSSLRKKLMVVFIPV